MKKIDWFFGRGFSMDCGLTWSVPSWWVVIPRSFRIRLIKSKIRKEMCGLSIFARPIGKFLNRLDISTNPKWQHEFYTTNWDHLLQRAFLARGWTVKPSWCAQSHVWHINGTAEILTDNSRRSSFVLETDKGNTRIFTHEGDTAFNRLIWGNCFVVVGMSFECEEDRYLLNCLQRVGDDLPVGEAQWFIVNPDECALNKAATKIQVALPAAKITKIQRTFTEWLLLGFPELVGLGVLYP